MRFYNYLIVLPCLIWYAIGAEPLLVVAIMVKNEESVIWPTLEPYIKADPLGQQICYLVYDTGLDPWSLTMQKARELFEEYHITNYFILQEPFVDFSTSRNRALDIVEEKYPLAAFVLMPDAEWYINDVTALLRYCQQERFKEGFGPYFVRLVDVKLDFFTPRLLRQNLHSRFKGVVHEALVVYSDQIPHTKLPAEIFFRYAPSHEGQKKSEQRYTRDRDLLLRQYQKNPHDTHATFYLAQTYEMLGDWENAYEYYTIRAAQPGWDEDNFLAAYRRAIAADNLESAKKRFSWPEVQELYLNAFAMRPFRIEPLIKIAQHYSKEQKMPQAFLYSRFAADFSYPVQDTNFVEKDMYDFERYNILGMCSWYLGYFELGEWAIRKAIEAKPDNPLLYKNLACYLEKKLKISNK